MAAEDPRSGRVDERQAPAVDGGERCSCGAPILLSGDDWTCSDSACVHGMGLRREPPVGLPMCLVCRSRPRARKRSATCERTYCRATWRRFLRQRFAEVPVNSGSEGAVADGR